MTSVCVYDLTTAQRIPSFFSRLKGVQITRRTTCQPSDGAATEASADSGIAVASLPERSVRTPRPRVRALHTVAPRSPARDAHLLPTRAILHALANRQELRSEDAFGCLTEGLLLEHIVQGRTRPMENFPAARASLEFGTDADGWTARNDAPGWCRLDFARDRGGEAIASALAGETEAARTQERAEPRTARREV
jgi:hypothetical protein